MWINKKEYGDIWGAIWSLQKEFQQMKCIHLARYRDSKQVYVGGIPTSNYKQVCLLCDKQIGKIGSKRQIDRKILKALNKQIKTRKNGEKK